MKVLSAPGSLLGLCAFSMALLACSDSADAPRSPSTEIPPTPDQTLAVPALVHLTDELSRADVSSAQPPAAARRKHTWSAAHLRDEWRAHSSIDSPTLSGVEIQASEQAIRVSLIQPPSDADVLWVGGLSVAVSGLRLSDWETLLVRARSSDRFAGLTASYNLDEDDALPSWQVFVMSPDLAPGLTLPVQ